MSENRKDQIIAAALKRFAHFGYSKTSMNEIAEDLRITKANLYYYYPDKETLLRDCTEHVVGEMEKREREIVDRYDGDIFVSILALLELHAEYSKDYYMLSLSEWRESFKDMGIQELVEGFDSRNKKNYEELFRRAVDSGELEIAEEDSISVGQIFYSIIKGLSVQCRVEDIVSGIPNVNNVQLVLEQQKEATKFILEGKYKSK